MKKIIRLLTLLARHDSRTLWHCRNVASLMGEWARSMGVSGIGVRRAYTCGMLHDVGKIRIASQILTKPEPLNEIEWDLIKVHPVYSYELVNYAGLHEISHIVRYHHERYDGDGYGEGLKGDRIPLLSRMLSVCDAFDAMTTTRSYTKAMRPVLALQEISRSSGSQFDPGICQQFIDFMEREKTVQQAL